MDSLIPTLDNPEPKPIAQTPWKLYFFISLGALALTAIGGGSYFKQKITVVNTALTQSSIILDKTQKDLTDSLKESLALKEEVNKERSKNKAIRDFYDNGKLKHEEVTSSASSESRVTDLEHDVESVKFERDLLITDNKQLKQELSSKVEKITERKDALVIDLGGEWDLDSQKVKAGVGLSKSLFNLLGISVNARVGVSK